MDILPAGRIAWLALPVDALDVFVDLGGQAMATLGAATLQNIAASLGSHACSETMDARPTANFGLICPFGHDLLTSMRKIAFYLRLPLI